MQGDSLPLAPVISKEGTDDLAPLPLQRAVAAWFLSSSLCPITSLFSADTNPGNKGAQLTGGLSFLPSLRLCQNPVSLMFSITQIW